MESEEVCKLRHKSVERDLEQLCDKVNRCASSYQVEAAKELLEARLTVLEADILALKSERIWMFRLVMGSIVMAVMSLVLIGGPLKGIGS